MCYKKDVPTKNIGSTALAIKSINPKVTPEMTRLNFILMTPTANYTIPLQDAQKLWHHPAFNRSLSTEILVTGWTSNINKSNSALDSVWQAYKCRGGVNFVVRPKHICDGMVLAKRTLYIYNRVGHKYKYPFAIRMSGYFCKKRSKSVWFSTFAK